MAEDGSSAEGQEVGHHHRARVPPLIPPGTRSERMKSAAWSWLTKNALLLAAGCLAIALVYVVVWVMPPAMVHGHGVSGSEALRAENDIRGTLVQALGGAALLAGLVFTARGLQTSRDAQFTDRFTRGIGQLGDASEEIRTGAILGLERIAVDSPADYHRVVEVLVSFVRERRFDPVHKGMPPLPRDVRTALSVLGRRCSAGVEGARLQLFELDLVGAHLDFALLDWADLTYSNLDGARLIDASMRHAALAYCTLHDVSLAGADLHDAFLLSAHLERCYLQRADLTDADLRRACLVEADLGDRLNDDGSVRMVAAKTDGADFTGADLRGARLDGVDLSKAIGLTREQIDSAGSHERAILPPRLRRRTLTASKHGHTHST